MEEKKIPISEYCKRIREESGLSANAFAKQKNVSHTYISDVELGKKNRPSIGILVKLINVYQLTAGDLSKMDVDPYFVDESLNVAALQHPYYAIKEGSFNNQVYNYINLYLVPNGYTITDKPFFDYKKAKRSEQTFDLDGYINPIYDVKGINPNGEMFFFFALSSARTTLYDEDYYKFVFNQMCPVVNSIEHSSLQKENKKIEIIFLTLSAMVNRFANKIKKTLETGNISITIVFFNMKVGKQK